MKRLLKAPHRITSPYGTRKHPITGKTSTHNGVDIAKPTGEPIFAHHRGKATQIYTHPTGGLTLIFDGDNGIQLRMCHLHAVSVKLGQTVEAGTKIAEVGGDPKDKPNCGASTGAHLHLGVMKNGVRIDPTKEFKL